MDLLTGATTFASLVGLIGQFKSGRDTEKGKDFEEFMTWLAETNHEELKGLIQANQVTSIGIKSILNQQNVALAAVLSKIDSALASFASTFEGFADVSQGLKPETTLSKQSLSILRQFDACGASKILELPLQGFVILQALDGQGGSFDTEDQQFLLDDLRTLVELGLLRPDKNPSGKNIYHFTRAAAALVRTDPTYSCE